ncbi:MAG: prepilin-type N-terminal cleavage/methylation domain-containing protein [Gammaproteobacteria bacterium]|nr:prepilin-type N-terminal cleavage/methylation domain-containing protein [Gammaproteobacteria bacterium]
MFAKHGMYPTIAVSRGFSLIEVLITVAVLAVGLVAMARFQGTALQASSLAKDRNEAVALAEQKIEQLRNFKYFSEIGGAALPCGTDTVGAYTRICSLGDTVTSGTYSYRNVTVQVTWSRPGASTADTTVTLTTTINNSDLRYSGELT